MEWLLIIGGYLLIRLLISSASGPKMGEFEIRTVEDFFEINGKEIEGIKIEARGLFGLPFATNVNFVTTVLDVTEDKRKPVLSGIDSFQEGRTMAYQFKNPAGLLEPNTGLPEWTQVAVAFPDALDCPRKGKRILRFQTFIADASTPLNIVAGFLINTDNVVNAAHTEKEINQQEIGYEEARENEEKAIPLIIKLAIFIAYSDGELDDAEGDIIKQWVSKILENYKGEEKEKNKKKFNAALKDGFEKVKNGDLEGSKLAEELNKIGDKVLKYQAVELCMDVMAADGMADENELKAIRKISGLLGLNYDEIEAMSDKRMVQLDVSAKKKSTLEGILGIDPDWPKEKIKSHLNKQFSKWNGRMQALEEGRERERAQEMLDLIADARQKYK